MKSERQQAILDLLDQHHSVSVNEISNTLSVSDMTIRRDLAELADKGLLVRVHGGLSFHTPPTEQPFHV